jgi:hypothetical protein
MSITMAARKTRAPSKRVASAAEILAGMSPLRRRLTEAAPILAELGKLPDSFNIDEAACEAITGVSRTTLWRIEHGFDHVGRVVREPEPLLRSFKVGPKRKLRNLGDVRAFMRRQRAQGAGSVAA